MTKIKDTVTIYEDWADIEGAIWYKWRLEGEKDWHWKRTAYKQKPFHQFKVLPRDEYELIFGENAATPSETHQLNKKGME